MPRKDEKLTKIIRAKIKFLESIPDDFIGQTVGSAEGALLKALVKDITDQLVVENGVILNTKANMQLVAQIDTVWAVFQSSYGYEVMSAHVANFQKIIHLNDDYYGEVLGRSKKFRRGRSKVAELVSRRLGINPDGSLIKKGYLGGMMEDVTVKNEIKEFVMRGVVNSSGFSEFNQQFRDRVAGLDGKPGLLRKWYRNIGYDVYKQADGLTNLKFSEEFDLQHFVYDGTLIKTSRKFCKARVGRVFTRKQAELWKNDPDLVASPLNYNPIVDMGGYACRHMPRFITKEMALDLDPTLAAVE